jgi:CDP-diglyceride synthetase
LHPRELTTVTGSLRERLRLRFWCTIFHVYASLILKLVLLLVIANAVPVISRLLMRRRFSQPIDANVRFLDGRPILGPAKTLRGVVSAILVTALMAPLFDLSPGRGSLFALLSMCGDLISSFIKRRLGIASSHSAPVLDQLPETLLPLWLMHPVLGETPQVACAASFIFMTIDWLISRLREKVSIDAGDAG